MAIEIKETFVVAAPIDAVWRFMNDPQNVVSCMPGATLKEVLDERRFVGTVKNLVWPPNDFSSVSSQSFPQAPSVVGD